MENTFGSHFFCSENTKNTENTKFRELEKFSKNTNIKIVFSMFSKTVLKNSFQKIGTKQAHNFLF